MTAPPYPKELKWVGRFKGGCKVLFRPILPRDAVLLDELFHSHSKRTIFNRYFCFLKELSLEQLNRFVNVDFRNDMAIVGLVPFEGRQKMICVGRYFKDSQSNEAEFAITVHDDWQRRGIGPFLLRTLMKIAFDHGIARLTADVLAENHAMRKVIRKCAGDVQSALEVGVYHMVFETKPPSIRPILRETAVEKSRSE